MSEILRLEHVDKHFGGLHVTNDVSFKVETGHVTGLIGPNGAGKSTLMNIISGIYIQDSGSLYFDGTEVTKVPPFARARMGIGRTFQTPRFLKRSNIRDNLLLGCDLAEQKSFLKSFFSHQKMDFEEELERYMKVAGFTLDLDSDITSLTYGQQKLLEIVRSLLAHPRLILVDEPAAGLNDKEKEDAMALINIAAEQGMGVLLIEHSMDMIMNMCADIVVINFGQIIATGCPEAVSSNEEVIEAYLGKDIDG
ncbi:ABC transporter ATP-binding protein [Oscillospiraceae bacterium MB08-C2-2]|nr:ABC transporter ATP-binding protein [Oscillospiraceae bacterium MB08-C2-2]